MLTLSDIVTAAINQMQTAIATMATSILGDLEKPDQMSMDILKFSHPKGLFIVGYQESEGAQRSEIVIISVLCIAITPQKSIKLAQAARIALLDYQITGATRFELHKDELMSNEVGIFVRNVQFRCAIPATPPQNRITAITALNL